MDNRPTGTSSQEIVAGYLNLLRQSIPAPDIFATPLSTDLPDRKAETPCAVILSPHPDDECLTGVLPLRLLREKKFQVLNIAVTLGSFSPRRNERKAELAKASSVLGMTSVLASEDGFENVTLQNREENTASWNEKVGRILEIIERLNPDILFLPHEKDWHPTHIGTHFLGMDALAKTQKNFTCMIVQTEYWSPIDVPNTIIGANPEDVATLISALSCHKGETNRNPYDKRFPAHLIDTVVRSEVLTGEGKAAPPMDFAQMYRMGRWIRGHFAPSALNRRIGEAESLDELFE